MAQQLHTYGLLTASFRPQAEIIILRRYLRHRETLVQEAATCIQRIQKALTEMNLQLANVISEATRQDYLHEVQHMRELRTGLVHRAVPKRFVPMDCSPAQCPVARTSRAPAAPGAYSTGSAVLPIR